MQGLGQSLDRFVDLCNESNTSFLIKDFKIDLPCYVDYLETEGRVRVGFPGMKSIISKSCDPALLTRITISGNTLLGIDKEDLNNSE